MKQPIHETVRELGQVVLAASVGLGLGCLVGMAIVYLGIGGFIAVAIATGAGLITLANVLKRRHECGVWRKP